MRVLIVAENLLARAGLAALVDEMAGCDVVGQTTTRELSYGLSYAQPDILLVDLGWTADRQPVQLNELVESDLPLIVLIPDDEAASDVLGRLARAENYGLLLRESQPDVIQAGLQAVYHGLVVLDAALSQVAIQRRDAIPISPSDPLTPREDEVLQLLAKGMTNKAIAHQLAITDHTVKFHVNAIMSKLGAQSRTEAVVKATQLGWIIL